MKPRSSIDESSRFRGGLKHYHRTGSQPQSSWDEWVEGEAKARPRRNWLMILGIVAGIAAVVAIGVGLVIEMS
jgi:hypothetical protein